jgi:thioredoxin reductase (NADPH)
MQQLVTPAIVAVAPDADLRRRLADVLERRFAPDYAVTVVDDPAAAIGHLKELAAAQQQVALVLAPFRLDQSTDGDGIGFLVEANRLHPGARRVVVIDVGDVSAAGPLHQALTLNQVDAYFGQPWASPEEEVYPLLAEVLRTWALAHQPRFEKAVVVDAPGGARGAQLTSWLNRNNVTTTLVAVDGDRGRALLADHGVGADRLPVAVLYDGRVLVDPDDVTIAEALGGPTRPTRDHYDVAIVGAGPAGLAAAVYAGSEGLAALVVEQINIGGQAGASAQIRNYLGFPWGVTGGDLTERANRQASQLGAEFVVARRAEALGVAGDHRVVRLAGGLEVVASTVVLTGGVAYRRLGVPEVDALVGAGVFYGAAPSDARSMVGLDVFVLGAGNSAAQSAAHLADAGGRVTLLVRGDSLAKTMSDYLVRQLSAAPQVTTRLNTEVVGAGTDGRLDRLVLRDRVSGDEETVPADALFVFIGAEPHTEWLAGTVALDDLGFVLTGADLVAAAPEAWGLERQPAWLETSLPGVFAAGDIRHGSIKRVAAAVGEGSTAAMLVREFLSEG